MLLHEVLAAEDPFCQSSPAWYPISANRSVDGKVFSPKLCCEHTLELAKAFIKEDNKDQAK